MRLWAMISKEFIHILRDPRTLWLAVGMPLLFLVAFGYIISFDFYDLGVAVYQPKPSPIATDYLAGLDEGPYFEIEYWAQSYEQLVELIDRNRVKIGIVMPTGMGRDAVRGEEVPIQIIADGSDNLTTTVAIGYLLGYSADFTMKYLQGQLPFGYFDRIPRIEVLEKAWYNPALSSPVFIVPGLFVVIMMLLGVILTSLTVAREWEQGTMEQLISTPIHPLEIIVGKISPYMLICLLDVALTVIVGIILFGVPFNGSVLLFLLITFIFLFGVLCLGLFISTATRSQQLAMMISFLSSMLPAFLLSGFIFPINSMPPIIQWFTYLVPARYYVTVSRAILLKGAGLSALWEPTLFLVGFCLVFVALSLFRFRKSLE